MMVAVLESGVPMLEDALSVETRQGASLLLMFLVDGLTADQIPYAPLLIVPLLGCMGDTDFVVRDSVIYSFVTLVSSLSLAKGSYDFTILAYKD